jgi:uncharacterized protein (TIGR03435 family)
MSFRATAITGSLLLSLTITTAAQNSPLAFEVASIKQAAFPSESAALIAGLTANGTCNQVRLDISGNRLSLKALSLCGLISMAYEVRDYLISTEAVSWIRKPERSLYYDIQANAPEDSGPLTAERARQMLQTLLADRFQLKIHREIRELSVYALVVAKNGPKLMLRPQGPCAAAAKAGRSPGLQFSFRIGLDGRVGGGGELASCQPRTSMAQLAQMLSRHTDRPVVDQTGLEGGHVFELQWGAEGLRGESDSLPSLFTAVQEQLGLKLEASKTMLEVMVVENVQRSSEN